MSACAARMRGFALVVPRDVNAVASGSALRATLKSLATVLRARTPVRAATLRWRNGKLL